MSAPRIYWTAAELIAYDFPEQRWAVPGVIAEGVNLLAGAPKIGKSWLGLGVAVAIASGGKALGRIDVKQGDVVYLALEDPPRRLAERLHKVLGQDDAPAGLSFVTASPPITDGGLDKIRAWLTEHPAARLVIIDVFARIRGRVTDNASAYDVDYTAMAALKTLADQHQVAILVIHHTRKAAAEDFLHEVSGTNGLAGAADAVLVLRRMRGSADAELLITGRDVDEAAYPLSFDRQFGAWQLLDGPAEDYTLGDTRKRLLEHLRGTGGDTPMGASVSLKIPHETAKKTLARMAKDEQIDTDGHGTYYPLPGEGLSPASPLSPEARTGTTGTAGTVPERRDGKAGRGVYRPQTPVETVESVETETSVFHNSTVSTPLREPDRQPLAVVTGNPRCTVCGRPNLFHPDSIARGICAACITAAS
jgi:AAA domain